MTKAKLTYKDSGVDIGEGEKFIDLIKPFVTSTYNKSVTGRYGGFTGACELPDGKNLLIGACDGVGTKLRIAIDHDRLTTPGRDLVAMSVNDLITCGAKPLFFLDYIATSKLDASRLSKVVEGIASGCRSAGCVLLGGETAEMPGFYSGNDLDMAGFAVGIVDKTRHINGNKVRPGDKIVSMPSTGIHSNGYSLVRKALFEKQNFDPDSVPEGLSRPLIEELLEPTAIYSEVIMKLLERFPIHSLSHITGGGLTGNIPRSLPGKCGAVLEKSKWKVPAIFRLIQDSACINDDDMYGTFNCGIGMVLVVEKSISNTVVRELKKEGYEESCIVGTITERKPGERAVRIV